MISFLERWKYYLGIMISLKSIPSEPANPPLLQNLGPHFLIKLDGIHIPVQHNPLHSPIPHLHRLLRHRSKQQFPEPFPPVALPHKQVLHIEPRLPQKRGEIREKQHKPGNGCIPTPTVRSEDIPLRVVDREVEIEGFDGGVVELVVAVSVVGKRGWGDFEDEDGEGLERRGGEEGGGEGGLGGDALLLEAFEDGHLVDELVDVGDVGGLGQAGSGEERVAHWDRA